MNTTELEKELLKQLVKARILIIKSNRISLLDSKVEIDKLICKSLGIDYYEVTIEKFQELINKVIQNEL